MYLKKVVVLLLISFLGFSMLGMLPVHANGTVIKCYADVTQLGDPVTKVDVIGDTFSVAVVVEDPVDMYAFDIQFNWTTDWIAYVDHEVTVPVDDYPAVQPPSPYAGILNEPIMKLKEAIDESASIPFAEEGTMAWLGWSESGTTPTFNESGTIAVMDFVVTDQPFCYDKNATVKIHFVLTGLSTDAPAPIPHTAIDLEIPLYCQEYEYKPSPMLKLTPEDITAPSDCVCKNFTVDVTLLGADGNDLEPVWDVAGCDFYVNFNATLIEAVDIDIDPDGDFGVFWSDGTYELLKEIDNVEGWAHIAFMGLGTHTAVFGTIRVAEITFHMIYEHIGYPPPSAPIFIDSTIHDIETNPWYIMDADGGLIDLSMPVGENFTALFPYAMFPRGFSLEGWEDVNGDGLLTADDQIKLHNMDTCKTHKYKVTCVQITLQLTQQPFPEEEDYVWATDSWTDYGAFDYCGLSGRTTADIYGFDGQGHGDWTGNFSLSYPFASVNSITANFVANGTSKVLTEGVDYKVYAADDKVELLTPVDVHIMNECWVDGANSTLDGWPLIGWTATSIQSVYVKFPNGTERYSPGGFGCFEEDWPCEWWYEPDYPGELEGWYILGYMGHDDPAWPSNSTWWINYTAGSYLTINYNAEPDPRPYYIEFEGDYADFLVLGDPVNTSWHEVYPWYCHSWNVTAFDDTDSSDDITVGDTLTLNSTDGLVRDYRVDALSTDIEVLKKPCVQDRVPGDPFYTDPVIVEIVGLPHPERPMSPWYGSNYPVPLPNAVENSAFQAIPEFNNLFATLLLLLSATMAIVTTRKLPKEN